MSIHGSHKGRGPRRVQFSAQLRPVPPERPDGRHALTARFVRHLLRQAPRLAFDPRMPGFTDPANRCRRRMPEEGLTIEEYRRYGNYGTEHYFKGEVAIPWLRRLFGLPGTQAARAQTRSK